MTVEVLNLYTRQGEALEAGLITRLRLKLFGKAPIGERSYPGWSGALEFWLFETAEGLAVDYPHGYTGRLGP